MGLGILAGGLGFDEHLVPSLIEAQEKLTGIAIVSRAQDAGDVAQAGAALAERR